MNTGLNIHFTGIGGVGMAALAHLALDLGAIVSGSDIADSANVSQLQQRGATVIIGHGHIPANTQLLVFSSAVPDSDAERQQAKAAGIRQLRRGDFLNEIAPLFQKRIAVSGSHGKTSTSAMIAHILAICGYNPAYIVGGSVNGWERPGTAGNGNILVTEVDESDGSQANFPATHAVVLNIDDDHSWALGGTTKLEQCFLSLCKNAQHIITWKAQNTERLFAGRKETRFISAPLPIPGFYGEHNRKNAAIAAAVCELFGISLQESIQALQTFPGVARRMTERLKTGNLVIVDDYAHHPTELQATLSTLREKYPQHQLCVIFQPHRMERVERYGSQFAQLLSNCNWVGIVETFGAWRQDDKHADLSALLTNKLTCPFVQLPNIPKQIAQAALHECTARSPVVLAIIGAGDVNKVIPYLLHS